MGIYSPGIIWSNSQIGTTDSSVGILAPLFTDRDDRDYYLDPSNTGTSLLTAGNVGIGTTSPAAKLEVDGDLKVTGAFKGNISSSSGSTGAPFPRPAYNSGWQSISPGGALTLVHNIGGNVDEYVVDLQFKDDDGWGINNIGIGGVYFRNNDSYRGAYWRSLTSNEIKVYRHSDDIWADKVRVRIWVYK